MPEPSHPDLDSALKRKKQSSIHKIIFLVAVISLAAFLYNYTSETFSPSDKVIGEFFYDRDGEKISAEAVKEMEYVLVYFSANWCPPCRKFTPELIKFYNAYSDDYDFEVILVSLDNSEKDMFKYMRKFNMPWLAAPYHNYNMTKRLNNEYGGRGIPNLVLLDKSGKVLSKSYQGNTYLGPHKVLSDFQSILGA